MHGTQPIAAEHRELFEAVRTADNIAVMAVVYRGDPTDAIVAIVKDGDEYIVSPLYVRITDNMLGDLTGPDGTVPA